MRPKLNPMPTQRGIQLKVPTTLRPRIEARARVQSPWPPNCVRTATVAGCAATKRRLDLQALGTCQDNYA